MGMSSYFLMSLFRQRDAIILQLERELGKDLNTLIRRGEDDSLEFKSSFRYDYRLQKVNKALEAVIMKTLAGFMNTQGGTLLIGVADDGSILGLENDFHTLSRKDSDGYTQCLCQRWRINSERRPAICCVFSFINRTASKCVGSSFCRLPFLFMLKRTKTLNSTSVLVQAPGTWTCRKRSVLSRRNGVSRAIMGASRHFKKRRSLVRSPRWLARERCN